MKTVRQQLVESYPPTEQAETDRFTRRLVTDDDDPLLWMILQMRKSQDASSNLSNATIARFEKSITVELTAQFREARQILDQIRSPQILKRLLLSKLTTAAISIVASTATVFFLLWVWSYQFEGLQPELTKICSTVAVIQRDSLNARSGILRLQNDSKILENNQKAIYETQGYLHKDILEEIKIMESIIKAAEYDKKGARHQ